MESARTTTSCWRVNMWSLHMEFESEQVLPVVLWLSWLAHMLVIFSLTCSSLCFHCCHPSDGMLWSPDAGLRSSLAIPDSVIQGGGAQDFWGIFLKARLRNWWTEIKLNPNTDLIWPSLLHYEPLTCFVVFLTRHQHVCMNGNSFESV